MSLRRINVRVKKPFDAAAVYTDAVIDDMIRKLGLLPSGEIEIPIPDPQAIGLVSSRRPRRDALRSRLITSGRWLANSGPKEAEPTVFEKHRVLKSASKNATALVNSLQMRATPDLLAIPNWLGPGQLQAMAALEAPRVGEMRGYKHEMPAGELLQEAIDGLIRLERWLVALEKRTRVRLPKEKTKPRNTGSNALTKWVADMRGIWLGVFERADFSSRPFARFLAMAAAPTPLSLSEKQARELTRAKRQRKLRSGGTPSKPKQSPTNRR